MSLTHNWFADVGMNSFTIFGYVGRPCVESVVRGVRIFIRIFKPFSNMIRQKRSRPTG